MARFKNLPKKEKVGKIIYGEGIVDEIVQIAVSELEHVQLCTVGPNKKIKSNTINILFDKDGVKVDVAVIIDASQRVPDIAFRIQEAVRHSVESMTDYHVTSVNVIIDGITFEEMPPVQQEVVQQDN